ncbi:MAG: helix-turn-helix domain-containing protein [Acidimicrobiia bacterium]
MDRAAAARYVGRSPATIDRWRGLGLRSHKDGRAVLINRVDLEEYINGS